jgi:hypothetical protein
MESINWRAYLGSIHVWMHIAGFLKLYGTMRQITFDLILVIDWVFILFFHLDL